MLDSIFQDESEMEFWPERDDLRRNWSVDLHVCANFHLGSAGISDVLITPLIFW